MNLKDFSLYEKIWFLLFCSIGIALPILWHDTIIGFVAFLSGIVCVLLAAKGLRLNYVIGIVNCLTYAYVSYQSGLFGEVTLNLVFYLPLQLVGYYLWKRKTHKTGVVEMEKLPSARLFLILTASFAAVVTYGVFLSSLEGQHTPYIDSTTNVLSIAAAILMLLRYREYWGFYIVVNAVSVVMWLLRLTAGQADALSMVVMWSAYLVNSVYGLTVWYRGTKNENSALSGKVRSVSPGS